MIPVTGRIRARPDGVGHAGPLGIRLDGIDDRSDQAGAGPLTPQDSHWKHTAGAWWFNMAMQVADLRRLPELGALEDPARRCQLTSRANHPRDPGQPRAGANRLRASPPSNGR